MGFISFGHQSQWFVSCVKFLYLFCHLYYLGTVDPAPKKGHQTDGRPSRPMSSWSGPQLMCIFSIYVIGGQSWPLVSTLCIVVTTCFQSSISFVFLVLVRYLLSLLIYFLFFMAEIGTLFLAASFFCCWSSRIDCLWPSDGWSVCYSGLLFILSVLSNLAARYLLFGTPVALLSIRLLPVPFIRSQSVRNDNYATYIVLRWIARSVWLLSRGVFYSLFCWPIHLKSFKVH